MKINLSEKNISKVEALIALYNNGRKNHTEKPDIKLPEAIKTLEDSSYVKEINGVFIDIDFSSNNIDTRQYDQHYLQFGKKCDLAIKTINNAVKLIDEDEKYIIKQFEEELQNACERVGCNLDNQLVSFISDPYEPEPIIFNLSNRYKVFTINDLYDDQDECTNNQDIQILALKSQNELDQRLLEIDPSLSDALSFDEKCDNFMVYKYIGKNWETYMDGHRDTAIPLEWPTFFITKLHQLHEQLKRDHSTQPHTSILDQYSLKQAKLEVYITENLEVEVRCSQSFVNWREQDHTTHSRRRRKRKQEELKHNPSNDRPWYQFPEDIRVSKNTEEKSTEDISERKFSFMAGCFLAELLIDKKLFQKQWEQTDKSPEEMLSSRLNNQTRLNIFEIVPSRTEKQNLKKIRYIAFHDRLLKHIKQQLNVNPRWECMRELICASLHVDPSKRPYLAELKREISVLTQRLLEEKDKQDAKYASHYSSKTHLPPTAWGDVDVRQSTNKERLVFKTPFNSQLAMREIGILQHVSKYKGQWREYLLGIIDAYTHISRITFSANYAAGGDLLEHIRTYKRILPRHFSELLKGLHVLHKLHIAHLDLKPANIFITPKGTLKIGDFGHSRKIESYKRHTKLLPAVAKVIGTRGFNAPEILEVANKNINTSSIGLAADIWSLGSTFYTMLTYESIWDSTYLNLVCSGARHASKDEISDGQRLKIYNRIKPHFMSNKIQSTLNQIWEHYCLSHKKPLLATQYGIDVKAVLTALKHMLLWEPEGRSSALELAGLFRKQSDEQRETIELSELKPGASKDMLAS